jgi:two-component SAPR family response regulator
MIQPHVVVLDALGHHHVRLNSHGFTLFVSYRSKGASKMSQVTGIQEDQQNQAEVVVTVGALGSFSVQINDQLIWNWRGELKILLFLFFVDRCPVTRNEIFEVFWPRLSIKEATNVFHVTKRMIGELLQMKIADDEAKGLTLTEYIEGFYYYSERVLIDYDVALLEAVASMIERGYEIDPALLTKVLQAKGDFMSGFKAPWILQRREQLNQLYANVAVHAGTLLLNGRPDKAIEHFKAAQAKVWYREDAVQGLIKALLANSQRIDAIKSYQDLHFRLAKLMGVKPSPETEAAIAPAFEE